MISSNCNRLLHDSDRPSVYSYVTCRIVVCLFAFAVAPWALQGDTVKLRKPKDMVLDPILHRVEQRYNRASTLSVQFTEKYEAGLRVRHSESGVLELRKPGRMRWDYTEPAGKLFLADGKHFYLYNPATRRVEVTAVKDSEDLRAPLAFLLGKLNFYKEFSAFALRPDGPDVWIEAEPNSPAMPYSKVAFLVTPDSRISRLRVTGDDLAIMDFTFSGEQLNPTVPPDRFVFHLPEGAELEDVSR